jgi:hypothetical protein
MPGLPASDRTPAIRSDGHHIIGFREELLRAIQESSCHPERLHGAFSRSIKCNFVTDSPSDVVSERTYSILSRMPDRPPSMFRGQDQRLGSVLILPYLCIIENQIKGNAWYNLQAVSTINPNIALVVLNIAHEIPFQHPYSPKAFQSFANTAAELLEIAARLSQDAHGVRRKHQWGIIRASLYFSWYQAAMLYFWYILKEQLAGYNFQRNKDLSLLLTPSLDQIVTHNLRDLRFMGRICNHAFQLLKTDRAAIPQDWRKFCQRYNFAGNPCCDCSSVQSCSRFGNMQVEEQSAHDASCEGNCPRLRWDKHSYTTITGPRAVCIKRSRSSLQYCEASEQTLAITHVSDKAAKRATVIFIPCCLRYLVVRS